MLPALLTATAIDGDLYELFAVRRETSRRGVRFCVLCTLRRLNAQKKMGRENNTGNAPRDDAVTIAACPG